MPHLCVRRSESPGAHHLCRHAAIRCGRSQCPGGGGARHRPGADPARSSGRPRHEAHAQRGQAGGAGARVAGISARQPENARGPGRTCRSRSRRLGGRRLRPDPAAGGAAPIQRAILAGDRETGITIMQMDAGLDTGAILTKTPVPIRETDTAASLHDALATAGATAIVAALGKAPAWVPQAQDDAAATYAAKLSKDEAKLDWSQPADTLARAVRAYNPAPGAWTLLEGVPLKIWSAQVVAGTGKPGEVLHADAEQLAIACGEGALALLEVQPAGSKRMSAAEVLAGTALHQVLPGRLQQLKTPGERGALQDVVYGSLRQLGRLDAWLAALLERPLTDPQLGWLLRVALYQLAYTRAPAHVVVHNAVTAAGQGWRRGLANAVLRNFQRRRAEVEKIADEQPSARWSHPDWWIDRLQAEYPNHWQGILEASLLHPPFTLRINGRHGDVATYLQRSEERRVGKECRSRWSPY